MLSMQFATATEFLLISTNYEVVQEINPRIMYMFLTFYPEFWALGFLQITKDRPGPPHA